MFALGIGFLYLPFKSPSELANNVSHNTVSSNDINGPEFDWYYLRTYCPIEYRGDPVRDKDGTIMYYESVPTVYRHELGIYVNSRDRNFLRLLHLGFLGLFTARFEGCAIHLSHTRTPINPSRLMALGPIEVFVTNNFEFIEIARLCVDVKSDETKPNVEAQNMAAFPEQIPLRMSSSIINALKMSGCISDIFPGRLPFDRGASFSFVEARRRLEQENE
jgi:hypothetical protein